MASLIAILGILQGCNLVPIFTPEPSPSVSNFSDEDITNYAQTVLKIESQRTIAYQKIEEIIDDPPPEIVCDRPQTIQQLPKDAQAVAVKFCNQSKNIAQESGLTSQEFNLITEKAQKDETLKKRIQNAMIRIRQPQ